MARIRTIKPEFWVSDQVAECSRDARLLFIGMWNFCDDAGRHIASAGRLRREVFPGDPVTTEEIEIWVSELIETGLIEEYDVGSNTYWQVTGWEHQRIDKPSIKYPGGDGEITPRIHKPLRGKKREKAQEQIIGRDGEKCCFCESTDNLQLDYIVPLNNGGDTSPDNLRILCRNCKTATDKDRNSTTIRRPFDDHSESVRGMFGECSENISDCSARNDECSTTEWNGMEGNGKEWKGNTSCSEPIASASKLPFESEKPILNFPTVGNNGKPWPLLQSKINEYAETYPHLDIVYHCRKALQWCVDNPSKRKTIRGMPAFLNRWLERAQNTGKATQQTNRHSRDRPELIHDPENAIVGDF